MEEKFTIPAARFAGEENEVERKKREMREALLKGKPMALGNGQKAPFGKLAGQENDVDKKMKEIRKALIEGKPMALGNGQKAPFGKLAAQWYEKNPQLLENEKISMARFYPDFYLDRLEDGRLCWVGILNVGIAEMETHVPRQYHIMAVYDNNHPNQQMGSSIRVYPMLPDVDELVRECGFRPHHLLRDDRGNVYLCTNEAGDQKVGQTVTTAASVLGWAQKWLIAYEMVLINGLSVDEFNRPGYI